jgi:hypothetical protein
MPLFQGFTHAAARDQAGALAYGITQDLDDAFLGATAEIARSAAEPGLYVCIQSDTADPERFGTAVELARGRRRKGRGRGNQTPITSKPSRAPTASPTNSWPTSFRKNGSCRSCTSGPMAFPVREPDLGDKPVPFPPAGSVGGGTRHRRRHEEGVLRRQARVAGLAGQRLVARLGGPEPVDSAPDSGDAGILSQRGSLRDELPALAARKRAEAEQIYPPLSDRAGSPTSGSLTAGAARLFNKALAAPRKNKIRPGAL